MEHAKEMEQQQTADQFWNKHFHDLLNIPVDEQYALEVNLWKRLQTAFATEDKDTLRAVALTRITIQIQSTDMFFRIVKLAKRAIDNID
jgi:hypothetical protein